MTRTGRHLLAALGMLLVAVGAVGVVLPVLPTTPFLILALWCFARSSDRFHNWLYHHRLFGPLLQDWDRYHVIPMYGKVASVGFMSASLAYVILFTGAPWWGIAGMAAVIAYAAWFVLTKPSRPPAEVPTSDE